MTQIKRAAIERFVLRPLFLLVTFSLLLFALLQGAGRLLLAVLPVFEDEINAVAQLQGVQIYGLQGDWHGFNPVIAAERVVFLGGHIDAAEFELDTFESILHNTPIAHRIRAADIFVDLVQGPNGWQLRGALNQPLDYDPRPLLEHSDYIDVQISTQLTNREGLVNSARHQLRAMNPHREHYLELQLDRQAQADGLQVRWWHTAAPLWSEVRSAQVDIQGAMRLPAALVGGQGARLEVTAGQWAQDELSGGGRLDLRASEYQIAGVAGDFALALQLQGTRRQDAVAMLVQTLELTSAAQQLDLSGGRAELQLAQLIGTEADADAGATQTAIRFWQEQLNLAQISSFAIASFKNWEPVWRWANGLQLAGTLHNVHVYWHPQQQLGYAATLADVAMRGYRGVPSLTNAQGQLWGYDQGAAARLNAQNLTLGFDQLFTDTWQLDSLQGVLRARIEPGFFALRGSALKTRIGDINVAGSFALSRPDERYEQRLGLTLNIDSASLDEARSFIPYKIPEELAQWLVDGPQSGHFDAATFVYHGQVHRRPDKPERRMELLTQLRDTAVRYDPAWPQVTDLHGRLHLAGTDTRVDIERASSQGVVLDGGQVVVVDNGEYIRAVLSGQGQAGDVLDLIRQSPLQQSMAFVTPAWQGSGDIGFSGELTVPLKETAPQLAVDLNFDVVDVSLDMPEYRLQLGQLQGSGAFSLPNSLTGEFSGQLFGHPANIIASHDTDWIHLGITGTATPPHIYQLINYRQLSLLAGTLPFDSRLNLAMRDTLVSNLELTSELVGLQVNLPAHLAKPVEQPSLLELDVQFLPEYQSVRWHYKDTQGWLHYGDEIERGAVGIGAAPPMTQQTRQAVVIRGQVDQLVLSEWVGDAADGGISLPLDWSLESLQVQRFVVGDLAFADLLLTGEQRDQDMSFEFVSDDLQGRVQVPADGLLNIDLQRVVLPVASSSADVAASVIEGAAAEAVDPIDVEVGRSLPAAQVKIDELILGENPFGRWAFTIAPVPTGVQFHDFGTDVNGIHIKGAELYWDLDDNQSHFQGAIQMDDLAQTLPKWDYAAALETGAASLSADIAWPGSPANVNLLGINGALNFNARDGRFLDVESGGGLRVLSLLNFSKIAKRISFDFSDVTREGMPFEKISAQVELQAGQMTLVERMLVDSSSSNFQIGGQVDLHTGQLNNEMIVTLPVSDSLPWYGVYLSLANPLAGLGVIVGERVLRKPLQAFSTAKFEVKGTLDDPQVKFIGLWDQSMNKPATADLTKSAEPPSGEVNDGD